MTVVEWFVAGSAEWYVAWQEDWQMYRISRRAWLVLAAYVAALVALLVWVI